MFFAKFLLLMMMATCVIKSGDCRSIIISRPSLPPPSAYPTEGRPFERKTPTTSGKLSLVSYVYSKYSVLGLLKKIQRFTQEIEKINKLKEWLLYNRLYSGY